MTRSSAPPRGTFSVLLAASLLISAAEFTSASNPTRDKAQSFSQFEILPLTLSRQNGLIVRALINGKSALLLVDTGTPATMIASSRCDEFGLSTAPPKMKWPNQVDVNGGWNKLVIAGHVQLAALDLVDVPVVVTDLGGLRRAARLSHEAEADGILGADVLLTTKAILNCQNQTLILNMTPDIPSRLPAFNPRGFSRVRFHVSSGLNPYVDSSINGARAQLMIDTGAFVTLLHRPFVNQLKIPVRGTRLRSAAINIADEKVGMARIRKLSIGWVNIVDKDVGVTNLKDLVGSDEPQSRPIAGLLGAEVLLAHQGIVDFGTRTLYLKK